MAKTRLFNEKATRYTCKLSADESKPVKSKSRVKSRKAPVVTEKKEILTADAIKTEQLVKLSLGLSELSEISRTFYGSDFLGGNWVTYLNLLYKYCAVKTGSVFSDNAFRSGVERAVTAFERLRVLQLSRGACLDSFSAKLQNTLGTLFLYPFTYRKLEVVNAEPAYFSLAAALGLLDLLQKSETLETALNYFPISEEVLKVELPVGFADTSYSNDIVKSAVYLVEHRLDNVSFIDYTECSKVSSESNLNNTERYKKVLSFIRSDVYDFSYSYFSDFALSVYNQLVSVFISNSGNYFDTLDAEDIPGFFEGLNRIIDNMPSFANSFISFENSEQLRVLLYDSTDILKYCTDDPFFNSFVFMVAQDNFESADNIFLCLPYFAAYLKKFLQYSYPWDTTTLLICQEEPVFKFSSDSCSILNMSRNAINSVTSMSVEFPYHTCFCGLAVDFPYRLSLMQLFYLEHNCLMPRDVKPELYSIKSFESNTPLGFINSFAVTLLDSVINRYDFSVLMSVQSQAAIDSLLKEISELQSSANSSAEIDILRNSLRLSEKEIASLTERYEEYKTSTYLELTTLRELVYNLKNEEDFDSSTCEDTEISVDFPYTISKKVIVYGGTPEFRKVLNEYIPDLVCLESGRRFSLDLVKHADVIWYQTYYMSHSALRQIISLKGEHAVTGYLTSKSAKQCAEQIAAYDMKVAD